MPVSGEVYANLPPPPTKIGKGKIMNAKSEFIEHVADRVVLCAKVTFGSEYDDIRRDFILCVGHTRSELDAFLQSLDFEYDDGYGGQELYGNIWYKDGSWSDRGEYDGSEWWTYQSCPIIPDECNLE